MVVDGRTVSWLGGGRRREGGGCPKPNIAAAVGTQPPTRQGPVNFGRVVKYPEQASEEWFYTWNQPFMIDYIRVYQ